MGMRACEANYVTPIWRKDPRTGYVTWHYFHGNIRLKPKGWRIGTGPRNR